jgi:hypothetical protein
MRRALSDPALLGKALAGESWRAWRVLLVASMGEALDDDERAIFQRLTGREREPIERVDELLAVVGRRGGKSRACATLVVYLACLVDYSNVLASGERPVCLCLAPTSKQAAIVLSYVAGIIEESHLLASLVKNRTAESIDLTNDVTIEIRAASFRSLRGVTAIAAVCDEICFWRTDDGSANPDVEILDALRPSLLTTGGPVVAISSPYARRGAAFETWSRHFGEKGDPCILVAQGASRDLNPTLPQAVIDRAMERDPAAASAEYLGQFRSDLEQFLSLDVVRSCVEAGVFERPPVWGITYAGFVDPSGGSSDSFTAAIAHREGDRLVLDAVREIRPPFSPADATGELASSFRSYKVSTIRGDRYAGEWPREAFRKHGVTYETADRDRSGLYLELLPLINSRRVSLLDNPRLVAQLVGLERRTSRGGRDSIDHAPGAHDDLSNAVAGVLAMLSVCALNTGFLQYYEWLARGASGGEVDPREYVRMRPPANVGAADGMFGRRYAPDADGMFRVHPDDVRPFRNDGFILLENQEVLSASRQAGRHQARS